jgi:hypothetical protein
VENYVGEMLFSGFSETRHNKINTATSRNNFLPPEEWYKILLELYLKNVKKNVYYILPYV